MQFYLGDIFSIDAEYLISSGNPHLNMSGGVNAQLREMFGDDLQVELHDYIKSVKVKHVSPGSAYLFKRKVGRYIGVTYCVGIDIWYESTKDIVKSAIKNSLFLFGETGNSKIAVTAMATGFGKMDKTLFGQAMKELECEIDCRNLVIAVNNEDKYSDILLGYDNAPLNSPTSGCTGAADAAR